MRRHSGGNSGACICAFVQTGCRRPELGCWVKTRMHERSIQREMLSPKQGMFANANYWVAKSVITLPQLASKDRFINSTLVCSGSVLIRFNFFKKVCFL